MKSRINPLLRLSSLLAATIAITTSAHADNYTWDGGTGNWNATNWNGATATGPTSAGNTATINSGTVTLNVGGPGALDSITLGSGAQINMYNGDGGIYAYQGLGNLILQGGTVNGGSSTYKAYGASFLGNVTVSGTAASTITGGSWFNVGNNTYTVADVTSSSATDLLVSTSLRGPVGSPDNTYTPASITKEGAGTMEITAHSWFWGGLTLNGGTLKVSNGNGGYGFFSGAVNVNSGTTLETFSDGTGLGWQDGWKPSSVNINGGTITTAGTNHIWNISGGVNMTGGTLQSNGGVSDANGGQLEWWQTNVNTNASADTATIGGRIRIRSDGGYGGPTFNVANGAAATDLLVSAAINEANGTVGITKSGAGTMVLSGANSYAGGTAVNEGTLTFANTSAKSSSGTTTVADGATLGLGVKVSDAAYFSSTDVDNLFAGTLGNVSNSATSNVGIDTTAGDFTYGSAVTGTRGLVKLGSNTLTLTAINSYSGGTIVNSGTLELNSTTYDQSVIRGSLTVNSGATVNITGYDYAGLGKDGGANVTALNVNGGTVNNTKTGSWLTGATVNLTGGTMTGGNYGIISSSLNSKASATTSEISSSLTIRKDYGSSDLSIDVENGDAATDLLISGNIGQVNAAALTKTGAGTLVLSGDNSYSGGTNVNVGTLLVNNTTGSGTGSGAVTVASGATLGGSGTVGGATTIQSGGHLAVGNSSGTQTFSSSLDLQSGSIFDWDLAGNTTSGPGTNFDSVNVTGKLTIASDAVFRVIQNTGLDFNDTFWDSTQTWSNIFSAGTLTSNWSNAAVSVYNTDNVLQNVASYGSFTITGDTLTWTAVPEPTSALAGLLIAAGLLRRRRAVG